MGLAALAHANAGLEGSALRHVQRLVESWQPLADLSFSDLLLLAPVVGSDGRQFVVLAHVRPVTGPTLYAGDLVGMTVSARARPLVARSWAEHEIVGGDVDALAGPGQARIECIPLMLDGRPIAVVSRESSTPPGRREGELERAYQETFERLARMMLEGTFPFDREEIEAGEVSDVPRVTDGVILLDELLRIRFTSPNANSSLHRLGVHASTQGRSLDDIGLRQTAASEAFRRHVPVTEEVDRSDTSMLVHAVPLMEHGRPTGAVILVRDVTDLRRRDRILVSKDATIREIHHRVKNNLQTIAALLRLQSRRLGSAEAQAAIEESERRIRSIAIVHETLARHVTDTVSFDEIIGPLVRVVEETVSTPELRLRFQVEGNAGEVPGDVATPLAVVLNELMQNAVDHAFAAPGFAGGEGCVLLRLKRSADELEIDVVDDGVGLPPRFSLERSGGLGLSIVQTLVTSELGGSIEMYDDHGARVHLRIPLASDVEKDVEKGEDARTGDGAGV